MAPAYSGVRQFRQFFSCFLAFSLAFSALIMDLSSTSKAAKLLLLLLPLLLLTYLLLLLLDFSRHRSTFIALHVHMCVLVYCCPPPLCHTHTFIEECSLFMFSTINPVYVRKREICFRWILSLSFIAVSTLSFVDQWHTYARHCFFFLTFIFFAIWCVFVCFSFLLMWARAPQKTNDTSESHYECACVVQYPCVTESASSVE